MSFEEQHKAFIEGHLQKRTGERRSRLKRGHRHAEILFLRQIWWLLVGHFENLHPEYEVMDWRGRSYFADFAWLPLNGLVKLLIEIKGFNTHVRDMDRPKYSNELNRETFLHAMGYHVISFAYDDVEQRPELCIALLRMVLARYQSSPPPVSRAQLAEKELIRLAITIARPIRRMDVVKHFDIDAKTAGLMLAKLCDKGWLVSAERGKRERILNYELAHGVLNYFN